METRSKKRSAPSGGIDNAIPIESSPPRPIKRHKPAAPSPPPPAKSRKPAASTPRRGTKGRKPVTPKPTRTRSAKGTKAVTLDSSPPQPSNRRGRASTSSATHSASVLGPLPPVLPALTPAPISRLPVVAPVQKAGYVSVTPPLEDHSRCRLHQDYENRRKSCNAQTYAKTRCQNKAAGSFDSGLWDSGLLPVCFKHKYSTVRRGECQATAACGHKCSRPVVLEPGKTQLCSHHKGEPRYCYLSKLPTELRLQIFELLIPPGPVPAKATRGYDEETGMLKALKSYATTAMLLRVDKQTCADVTALLYQCPARPFEIEVSANSIDFGKTPWYFMPSLLVSSSRGAKHVNALSKSRLDRIRHLKIKVLANRTDSRRLHALLVNIRKLREALQEKPTVAEEAQLGDSDTSSCLGKLEIELVYEEYEYAEDPEFYPSEIFAFSRLILQFFRNLPVNFTWTIEWNVERARRYYSNSSNNAPKKTKMTMTKRKGKITNMKVDMEEFDTDAAKFRSWAKKFNSKTINTMLVSTWQQFKELELMVSDLMNLKMLREDGGHANFMFNARVALETRDSKVLDAMKAQLRGISQKYVAAKMALLQKVQQKFLLTDEPGDGIHNPDEVLFDPSSYMSWPLTTTKPIRKGKPDEVIGGTLEEYADGDEKVYQLITPDLLSQRRKAKALKDANN